MTFVCSLAWLDRFFPYIGWGKWPVQLQREVQVNSIVYCQCQLARLFIRTSLCSQSYPNSIPSAWGCSEASPSTGDAVAADPFPHPIYGKSHIIEHLHLGMGGML